MLTPSRGGDGYVVVSAETLGQPFYGPGASPPPGGIDEDKLLINIITRSGFIDPSNPGIPGNTTVQYVLDLSQLEVFNLRNDILQRSVNRGSDGRIEAWIPLNENIRDQTTENLEKWSLRVPEGLTYDIIRSDITYVLGLRDDRKFSLLIYIGRRDNAQPSNFNEFIMNEVTKDSLPFDTINGRANRSRLANSPDFNFLMREKIKSRQRFLIVLRYEGSESSGSEDRVSFSSRFEIQCLNQ
jgi:hypothetical protein